MRCARHFLVGLGCLLSLPIAGQQNDSLEIQRLRTQIDAITRQLEVLRLGRDVAVEADTSLYGFGPAASKVYRVPAGVSIGGYGEVLYQRFAESRQDGAPAGLRDRWDALRAVLYVGYKFDDRFVFNSEIEFEHGSTADGVGQVSVELAQLDYRIHSAFGLRAGLLLVPMGIINELHEPPIFLGAVRPVTETRLIPSTWRENGVGLFGAAGSLAWRAYLVAGLDADGFGAGGLRGGRQQGVRSLAEDVGVVGRVDWQATAGLTFSGSAYLGNSGQDAAVNARTFLAEAHGIFQRFGLDLRALVAVGDVDDVAALNAAAGLAGDQSIGERLSGWYAQAGYNVLRGAPTVQQLIPYVRVERVNTQARVPAGFSASPANDLGVVTLGFAWKPRTRIALKGDYQIHTNRADTGVNQAAVALGYLF